MPYTLENLLIGNIGGFSYYNKMIGIFIFEMLGTAAITTPTSILYQQATF